MEYYAHKKDGKKQYLKDHLEHTAALAKEFSVDSMKAIAWAAGKYHDLGKYGMTFQKERLENDRNVKYEHSSPGAIELGKSVLTAEQKAILPMLQYCIMGHHSGLPDGGTNSDTADDGTLHGRLKREYTGKNDYSAYKNEIKIEFPEINELLNDLMSDDYRELMEKYAFFTRYIFSCLTDADYLDTEKVYNPDIDRELKSDFETAYTLLDKRRENFPTDTELQRSRTRLLEQALRNLADSKSISILNMPTGSGKTYCSLKLAFEKIRSSGKKRIIYVIPYTSIIEQTAKELNKIFGNCVDVLQHHSNYSFEPDKNASDEEKSTAEKLHRSTENWNAPIIVTTSVQFFQSLYHYRSSSLRKLHNMADSVIIFDEVHLLPVELLQPCLRAIGYITKYLNSEAIFLSATMPDYSELFRRYMPGCEFSELISDKSDFTYYNKCKYTYLKDADYESVAEKAQGFRSSLIVVNKKKTAAEIYKMLSGNRFHLSASMTPKHRTDVIEKIRTCLKNEEQVTVVSTSLIEAGVDLDFEAVFREAAGLDSILQSGGRCNREGRNESGSVYIFDTGEKMKGEFEIRTEIVRELLEEGYDISSDAAVREYYERLFKNYDDSIEDNTIYKAGMEFDRIPFRKYAESFRFINEDTVSVVINNCDEANKTLQQVRSGGLKYKRELQQYSVSLRVHGEFDVAMANGIISEFADGVYVLGNNDYYKSETGLDLYMADDKMIDNRS